jgi:acyl-CoA synthetase (AMP-forming)/AMP-acid ligase II
MLSKALRHFSMQPSLKFPAGTVAGHFKQAVATNSGYDIVRFDNQRLNWTLKEFDRYSSAFAFGLLESGYTRGDSLVLYADQTASAEQLVAQRGAFKAGVKVVTFAEKDS